MREFPIELILAILSQVANPVAPDEIPEADLDRAKESFDALKPAKFSPKRLKRSIIPAALTSKFWNDIVRQERSFWVASAVISIPQSRHLIVPPADVSPWSRDFRLITILQLVVAWLDVPFRSGDDDDSRAHDLDVVLLVKSTSSILPLLLMLAPELSRVRVLTICGLVEPGLVPTDLNMLFSSLKKINYSNRPCDLRISNRPRATYTSQLINSPTHTSERNLDLRLPFAFTSNLPAPRGLTSLRIHDQERGRDLLEHPNFLDLFIANPHLRFLDLALSSPSRFHPLILEHRPIIGIGARRLLRPNQDKITLAYLENANIQLELAVMVELFSILRFERLETLYYFTKPARGIASFSPLQEAECDLSMLKSFQLQTFGTDGLIHCLRLFNMTNLERAWFDIDRRYFGASECRLSGKGHEGITLAHLKELRIESDVAVVCEVLEDIVRCPALGKLGVKLYDSEAIQLRDGRQSKTLRTRKQPAANEFEVEGDFEECARKFEQIVGIPLVPVDKLF